MGKHHFLSFSFKCLPCYNQLQFKLNFAKTRRNKDVDDVSRWRMGLVREGSQLEQAVQAGISKKVLVVMNEVNWLTFVSRHRHLERRKSKFRLNSERVGCRRLALPDGCRDDAERRGSCRSIGRDVRQGTFIVLDARNVQLTVLARYHRSE